MCVWWGSPCNPGFCLCWIRSYRISICSVDFQPLLLNRVRPSCMACWCFLRHRCFLLEILCIFRPICWRRLETRLLTDLGSSQRKSSSLYSVSFVSLRHKFPAGPITMYIERGPTFFTFTDLLWDRSDCFQVELGPTYLLRKYLSARLLFTNFILFCTCNSHSQIGLHK